MTAASVDLGGISIFVRELPGEGPPLVMFHGLSVDGSVWQAISKRLYGTFRLFMPDLRGHGRSGHPVSGYLASDFAADAALLIEWLAQKWGPLHVLGHSLGAIAALGGAVLRPDLVKKLILEEPPFDGPVSIGPYLAGILTAKRAHDEDLLPVVRTYAPELGLALARIQAGMWERVAPGAIAAVLDQPEQVFGVTSWLAETTMPALILQADPAFGAHLTNEAATQAVQQLPQGHWRQVLGAGHIIHATHPAAFCQEVKDFLLP